MKKILFIIIVYLLTNTFAPKDILGNELKVVLGADILLSEKYDLIKGKKVGLIVNHTSILSNGKHLVDLLYEKNDLSVVAIFAPEHGFRGDTTGAIENSRDSKTGIPIYSLYGKTYKPTREMLKGIDILIFDIQDVGARFYTYISTLGFAMETADENNIPIIVLDRPNPITGLYVDGPITEDSLKSFVAYASIPILHGMTIGEIATLYNENGWLTNKMKANLIVVKMKGWKRNFWYDELNLNWIKPSPNMPTLSTAIVYPGTCLFEGTNVSEGRGTEKPFEFIGAPWLDSKKIIDELNKQMFKGVSFEEISFTPEWYNFNSHPPKFHNEKCNGIYIKVLDRNKFEAVKFGVGLIWAIKKIHPTEFKWKKETFDRLTGIKELRIQIDKSENLQNIFSDWNKKLNEFKLLREKFLLY